MDGVDKAHIIRYILCNYMYYARAIMIFAVLFLAAAGPARGQDFDRATRATDQLSREAERKEKEMLQAPRKPEVKEPGEVVTKKEGKPFFLREVRLEGCESLPPEEFKTIIDRYTGKEVYFGELDAMAGTIAREYLRRGIIAAVFVPPQEIKDQTVEIRVVEAKMGELIILPHKYFKNKRLGYFWRTKPGEVLHYDKMSRNLQIMNRNPDRESKAALKAGTKPGTTDVVLSTETKWPLHFNFSFDKEGQTPTGKTRTSFGGRDNNLLGLDDTLISGYSRGRNFFGSYFYHSLPVSPNGASLVYGYSYGESYPKKDFADWGFDSKAENKTVALHQDLFRKDDYFGEVYADFEAKDKLVKSAQGLVNRDKLRILRIGGNFVTRSSGSSMTISPEVSNGIGAFAASSQGDPLVSRGANSVFQKLKLGIRSRSAMPLGIQENFRFALQYATSKLTPQEEYSLGGLETVRGYPPDDFYADNAVNTSLEFLIPSYFIPKEFHLPYASKSLREQVTSVLFTDYGYGIRYGEDNKSHSYFSIGAGLRIDIYNQGVLRLEWGVPLGDRPITESKATRFHISVDIQESLPEEIMRIQKAMAEERIRNYAWQIIDDELNREGSPIREMMMGDLRRAEALDKEGRLEEAKVLYEKIDSDGKAMYAQAEAYVRSVAAEQQELAQRNKDALAVYEEGNIEKARELWQKVIEDAKFKPLTLKL